MSVDLPVTKAAAAAATAATRAVILTHRKPLAAAMGRSR